MQFPTIKQIFFRKSVVITFVILLMMCFIEFAFDPVERTFGVIVEATNSFRPQSGTIWELYKKDRLANENLMEMTQDIAEAEKPPDIVDFYSLKNALDERGTVVISADQFLKIYNTLPPSSAQAIISPLELLKTFDHNQWVWTKITKGESSLHFYFLDGANQLLMDSYPDLSIFFRVAIDEKASYQSIETMNIFSGRTITPEQFFNAFNRLPNSIKLQLINNPFQLVKWHGEIRSVAIARYIEGNTVLIGFEISNGVHTFQASEIAVNFLITQLNSLYPALKLTMPVELK